MSTIFPSQNTWITPRSEQGQITTENSLIILPQKIERINKAILHSPNTVLAIDTTGFSKLVALRDLYIDEQHTMSLAELDITNYIVDEAQYQTLSTYNASVMPGYFTSLYTNNSWYYEHNGTNIILPNNRVRGNLEGLGQPIIAKIITSAVYSYIYNNGNKDGRLYYYNGNANSSATITYSDKLNIFFDEEEVPSSWPDIRLVQFRIYYTPLGESVKLQVPKTNPQVNEFCIPYSQQQPIVDNISFGREMQSVANRAGCETKEVVRTCRSFAELRRPKDGWAYIEKGTDGKPTGNVWRLTAAHYSIYSEKLIITTETWSKNWSYRSDKVPINREFRSWNIPADIVQRNLLWQDYCLITRKTVSFDDTSILSNDAKRELINGLTGEESIWNATECSLMWFYRINVYNQPEGAVLSCSAFGFGNSLVFSGKTKDNLSAGVQRVQSDTSDNNYQFCKDVYYCGDNGRLDHMNIQVGAQLTNSGSVAQYVYPQYGVVDGVVRNGPEGLVLFKQKDDATGKSWNLFYVKKDPAEQLNFTYQLHLLTDDGFLVIGSTWAATNPLVKQRDKAQTIKVWKLTRYLPAGAQVMTASYGEESSANLFAVDTSSASPSITFNPEGTTNNGVGVCVTDENNAVLIAFNSNEPATFTLHFTHDYTAMARALKNNN